MTDKSTRIDRRKFVTAVGAGAATSVALAQPAIASGKRVLSVATPWPRAVKNGNSISLKRIAKTIELATDGELAFEIHWLGERVKPRQEFDAASKGEIDGYFAPEVYWDKKSAGYNFFGSLPFGMTAMENEAWLYQMGGQELWDSLSGKFNIKPFAAGNTGAQMAGWFKKPIDTLSDLKGVRIRMPGIAGKVYKELGAKPLFLPANKLVSGMKENKADAVEFVGPWPDMKLGLHKIAKHYYWPGFQSPGAVVALGINRQVWDSLSPAHQEIIKATCMSEYRDMLSGYASNNGWAMNELRHKHKVDLRQIPTDVLNELGVVSGDVVADSVRGDKLLAKVYNSYVDSRIQLIHWAKYSDEAFLVARRLPFPYSPKHLRTVPRKPLAVPTPKKTRATVSRI